MANDCKTMGVGELGNADAIFKRKFRWGLTAVSENGTIDINEHFVKVAARPSITFEETEINMKNGKFYIPGKASWESITVTFYDVAGGTLNNGLNSIYSWVASVYDFTKGIRELCMGAAQQDYTAKVTITMYTGGGSPMEKWYLVDAWPAAVNWQDLDYSSSEEATIEMTLRYADVLYENLCGEKPNPNTPTTC